MVYRPNTKVSGDRRRAEFGANHTWPLARFATAGARRRAASRCANERRFLGECERTTNENSRLSPNIRFNKRLPLTSLADRVPNMNETFGSAPQNCSTARNSTIAILGGRQFPPMIAAVQSIERISGRLGAKGLLRSASGGRARGWVDWRDAKASSTVVSSFVVACDQSIAVEAPVLEPISFFGEVSEIGFRR
jgi:hypothetical protein